MRIGDIILGLRGATLIQSHFNNTSGETNIFGAAELDLALQNTLSSTQGNCAFVVPTGDKASGNSSSVGLVQNLTESFSIITAVRNDLKRDDYQGVNAYNYQHDIRKALFKAMLGWYITDDDENRNVSQIQYVGSNIVGINGAYLWWQYDFKFDYEVSQLGEDGHDGYNPDENNNLAYFEKIYADYIRTPSFKFETLEYSDLPLSTSQRDAAQLIDLTVNPKGGAFWFGFSNAFDRLER